LIRYQALSAIELSRQPPPLGGTAINELQDAVEAFLRLCVEHLRVPVSSKSEFLQVFDAVDKHPSVNGRNLSTILRRQAELFTESPPVSTRAD
jgi:hypothetical protein